MASMMPQLLITQLKSTISSLASRGSSDLSPSPAPRLLLPPRLLRRRCGKLNGARCGLSPTQKWRSGSGSESSSLQDEYDKVALGKEDGGKGVSMEDAISRPCGVRIRDPRANHAAAKMRLKEDEFEANK
ncbi:unnamed protein product [Brassica oleracea]